MNVNWSDAAGEKGVAHEQAESTGGGDEPWSQDDWGATTSHIGPTRIPQRIRMTRLFFQNVCRFL